MYYYRRVAGPHAGDASNRDASVNRRSPRGQWWGLFLFLRCNLLVVSTYDPLDPEPHHLDGVAIEITLLGSRRPL